MRPFGRFRRFYSWRRIDIYKLLYGLSIVRPLQVRLLYMLYAVLAFTLSLLKSPKCLLQLLERTSNSIIKRICKQEACSVEYEVVGGLRVKFLVSDLDGIQVVSPLHEWTFVNLLYKLIRDLKGNALFIDVGAHVGRYTVLFSKLFPQLEIVAIEPNKLNTGLLLLNLRLNNIKNVLVLNKALGNIEGGMKLCISNYSGRHSIVSNLNRCERVEEVEVTTLDRIAAILQGIGSRHIIVKIDVEGVEGYVIQGAYATLTRLRPILLIKDRVGVALKVAEYGYRCIQLQELLTKTQTEYVLCIPIEGV